MLYRYAKSRLCKLFLKNVQLTALSLFPPPCFILSFFHLVKILRKQTVVKTMNFTLRQEFSADYLCKTNFLGGFPSLSIFLYDSHSVELYFWCAMLCLCFFRLRIHRKKNKHLEKHTKIKERNRKARIM